MGIKISAVLATYNREKYLFTALNSLKEQCLNKKDFEIIIVNNNSTDSTENISKEFIANNDDLNIKYVIENNQGLSFSRNRGIKESTGDYITFVDDDAYLAPDFLRVCVDFMNNHPNVSAIGGKILLDYEKTEPNWATSYLTPLFGYFSLGDTTKPFPKNNFPKGSNMTFKKEVFTNFGLFNVNLGRVGKSLGAGEEKDLYYRLKKHNAIIYYIPTAIVFHAVPEFRTKSEFIKKQALATGESERIRVFEEGKISIVKRFLIELFKWGASFFLFILYFMLLTPAKGIMILKFRFWVTSGFLKKNYNEQN